jgi:hypothetical protein
MNKRFVEFRWRAFTTLLVATGFAALLVSGGVLFLSPPGRIANWTQWEILGLTKRAWSDVHIAFSALFLVVGVVHLAFNWRPLLQHLGARWSSRRVFRPEWLAAALVALGLFTATRAHWPPVSSLIAWSERLRESWDVSGDRAPIPHAELLSLRELSSQAGTGLDDAIHRLEAAGIRPVSADSQVQTIADAAHVTPARIYELIRAKEAPSGRSEKQPGNRGPGGGPGWKTLSQFCADEGLDLAAVQARLEQRGLKSATNQTLREIALSNGMDRPYALLEILRQK